MSNERVLHSTVAFRQELSDLTRADGRQGLGPQKQISPCNRPLVMSGSFSCSHRGIEALTIYMNHMQRTDVLSRSLQSGSIRTTMTIDVLLNVECNRNELASDNTTTQQLPSSCVVTCLPGVPKLASCIVTCIETLHTGNAKAHLLLAILRSSYSAAVSSCQCHHQGCQLFVCTVHKIEFGVRARPSDVFVSAKRFYCQCRLRCGVYADIECLGQAFIPSGTKNDSLQFGSL